MMDGWIDGHERDEVINTNKACSVVSRKSRNRGRQVCRVLCMCTMCVVCSVQHTSRQTTATEQSNDFPQLPVTLRHSPP